MSRNRVERINAYLTNGVDVPVRAFATPISPQLSPMRYGNHAYYGAGLLLSARERDLALREFPSCQSFLREHYGAKELLAGSPRYCLWVTEKDYPAAICVPFIRDRMDIVRQDRMRVADHDETANKLAATPWAMRDTHVGTHATYSIPRVFSERYTYLPVANTGPRAILSEKTCALYDAPLWNVAILTSGIHMLWARTVCVRMRTDLSYSHTLGWNTFPVPKLTEREKADLTESAERILRARERHPSLTLGQLYKEATMPDDLREAHALNDELVERIIAGKAMDNDTERLEILFALYERMTAPGSLFA